MKEFSSENLKKTKARVISQGLYGKMNMLSFSNTTVEIPVLGPDNDQSLLEWGRTNLVAIEELFSKYKVLLFRGFKADIGKDLNLFANLSGKVLIEYVEPSTPRTRLLNKIYTSTEYPKEQFIPLHNEQSYASSWARRIWFSCIQPASTGGETPLADSHEVFTRLGVSIQSKFKAKGVMYIRNFGPYLDLKWEDVYETHDKAKVESILANNGVQFEWKPNGGLMTKQIRPAITTHPDTKKTLWFNQAHLFNIETIEPEIAAYLIKEYGVDNLPRNSFYGDGSEIEPEVIRTINECYKKCKMSFAWQSNDVLMVDNMQFAHGRNPFLGSRKVVVCMADEFSMT